MSLYVSAELERRVEELVQRRLAGEPVAYTWGSGSSMASLWISPGDVLIPRSDTEVLAERAILRARAAGEGARVLDLCAGSGCVGLAVAANVPACRVVLGELSEGALRVVQAERPPQQPERPGHLCQRQCPGAPGLCPVGL